MNKLKMIGFWGIFVVGLNCSSGKDLLKELPTNKQKTIILGDMPLVQAANLPVGYKDSSQAAANAFTGANFSGNIKYSQNRIVDSEFSVIHLSTLQSVQKAVPGYEIIGKTTGGDNLQLILHIEYSEQSNKLELLCDIVLDLNGNSKMPSMRHRPIDDYALYPANFSEFPAAHMALAKKAPNLASSCVKAHFGE